jgi:hypothetical protein
VCPITDTIKRVLIDYHERISSLEDIKFDLEYAVKKKDFEVELCCCPTVDNFCLEIYFSDICTRCFLFYFCFIFKFMFLTVLTSQIIGIFSKLEHVVDSKSFLNSGKLLNIPKLTYLICKVIVFSNNRYDIAIMRVRPVS